MGVLQSITMKIVLLLVGFFAIVLAEHVEKDFGAFKKQYNKKYQTIPEDIYRQEVFEENVDYINQHNLEAEQGLHTFTLGLNEYADLSTKEWKMFLLGLQTDHYKPEDSIEEDSSDEALPESVDWRTEGYVTDIKNQGHC